MAYMVDVFTLTGPEAISDGDFLAAMFVALGGAALVAYFTLGYGTNYVSQVCDQRAHSVQGAERQAPRQQMVFSIINPLANASRLTGPVS